MRTRVQGRNGRASASPPRLSPWLVLAGTLHLPALGALLVARAELAVAPAALMRRPTALSTEELWLDVDPEEPAPARPEPRGSADEPSGPGATLASAAQPRATLERAAARHQPAPHGVEEAAPAPAGAGGASQGTDAAGTADLESAAREGDIGPARRLSLQQLGVGGENPFLGSPADLPTERQKQNQRLRQSLRGELARRDQARGLGPEGPAVSAVTEIVMASATAPNTTALLRVRTDPTGRVTFVEVLEADRDDDEWQRIAERLQRALANRKLRVPARSNGVSFQLRVTSRVQLPSGADPGLAIDLFGIPVKKGEGDRSARLSVLSPMIVQVPIPGADGATMPALTVALIGGAGDLADIGAVARRLVSAYLVSLDTDIPSETQAVPSLPVVPAGVASP
jgi:hypothetical protein